MELLSSYLLPIMMTIAWLAAISVATKNLVYDRENGQEEVNSVICNEKWFDLEQGFICRVQCLSCWHTILCS